MTSAVASAVRPGLRDNRQPSSPHTPTRLFSSSFSSPGSTFRQEEDAVVIELGSRHLRAGFEGESFPQCTIAFGPENNRRVGDYRFWSQGNRLKDVSIDSWGADHELWQNELKSVDLGLVEDRLERAIRDVYNKYLLTDAGTARLVLVLPSVLPHPILSSVLITLFERWNYSTITLLPNPTMATVAAGLRSALVVDIGWEETVVSAVYEYRELRNTRSTRAMKMLTHEMAKTLKDIAREHHDRQHEALPVGFDFVEEVTCRVAFCFVPAATSNFNAHLATETSALALKAGVPTHMAQPSDFVIDWPFGTTSRAIDLPRSTIASTVEASFLECSGGEQHLDDHETSLPEMVYRALLHLSPDVRGACMSRIVFVGGGSRVVGLSQRILYEVDLLIKKHGWSAVRGKKFTEQRNKLAELAQGRIDRPAARHDVPVPAEKDYVEEKVQKQQAKVPASYTSGVLRQVESLGSWTGASLLTNLKIKGFVEVERERFLSHGLAGANREIEISVIPQRMSSFGIATVKSNDKSSWTLAGWG